MKNIRKKQIRNLFNNFTGIICNNGIWFFGIKEYGKYKEWHYNEDLIFEIEFKDNKLISINYVDFKYNEDWFNYYDQIQNKLIDFYDKVKEIYNEKYKKKTN